jgi:RNA polymerase sigma-70 factor (ECF subfamily)
MMNAIDDSLELVRRVRAGDETAADALFHRYLERLIDLARSRLSRKMARRLDAEDVVQSAYRSFFLNIRHGRYQLQFSGDLWRLLAAITIHKVRRQVRRHTAEKRSVDLEESGVLELILESQREGARMPTPDEAATLVDELQQVLAGLSPLYRQIFEYRLQDRSVEDVARRAACSERTAHRALAIVRQQLEARLLAPVTGRPAPENEAS